MLCRQQEERYISVGCAASLANEAAAWLRGEAWRAMTSLTDDWHLAAALAAHSAVLSHLTALQV